MDLNILTSILLKKISKDIKIDSFTPLSDDKFEERRVTFDTSLKKNENKKKQLEQEYTRCLEAHENNKKQLEQWFLSSSQDLDAEELMLISNYSTAQIDNVANPMHQDKYRNIANICQCLSVLMIYRNVEQTNDVFQSFGELVGLPDSFIDDNDEINVTLLDETVKKLLVDDGGGGTTTIFPPPRLPTHISMEENRFYELHNIPTTLLKYCFYGTALGDEQKIEVLKNKDQVIQICEYLYALSIKQQEDRFWKKSPQKLSNAEPFRFSYFNTEKSKAPRLAICFYCEKTLQKCFEASRSGPSSDKELTGVLRECGFTHKGSFPQKG